MFLVFGIVLASKSDASEIETGVINVFAVCTEHAPMSRKHGITSLAFDVIQKYFSPSCRGGAILVFVGQDELLHMLEICDQTACAISFIPRVGRNTKFLRRPAFFALWCVDYFRQCR